MNGLKEIKLTKVIIYASVGFLLTYLIGNTYFYLIMNLYLNKAMSMIDVMGIMIPFMIKDYALLILASYSATIVIPILRRAGYTTVKLA